MWLENPDLNQWDDDGNATPDYGATRHSKSGTVTQN